MDCGFSNDEGWFRYRAAAIIIEDGCILMAKNDADPYYYSVGGAVHLHETAENAVIREVFEETGVEYEVDRLAFVHENFFIGCGSMKDLECHEVAFYFLMKSRGAKELNDAGYINGSREHMCWLPIDRLNDHTAYPSFFIEKLLHMGENCEHIVSYEYEK